MNASECLLQWCRDFPTEQLQSCPVMYKVNDVQLLSMAGDEGKRVAEGIGGLGQWAQGMRHAPLQLSTGQRGVRRVQTLWHERVVPQMRQAYSGITLGFVVKVRFLLAEQANGRV